MSHRYVKWILGSLLCLTIVVIVSIAAAFFWYQKTIRVSQPQLNGYITADGLLDPVKIIRDTHGVPHIYARNEPDLFFGFGYAMAQDRLWQMDLFRRIGSGRLSEILGTEAVEIDIYFRTLTAGQSQQSLPRDLGFMIESFAAGINAYIGNLDGRLPLEYKILRIRPEPWQPEDYFSVFTLINWGLSIGWKVDMTAAEVLRKVDENLFREAFPTTAELGIPILSHIKQSLPHQFSTSRVMIETVSRLTGIAPGPASNNWVIAGNRTQSGKPLLANDTHMALTNPSLWWEVHLVCPTIDATGFAIPGLPGLPVGRNRNVAWGVTNIMVDDVDFYIEQLNPTNRYQYRYGDRWQDIDSHIETFSVKGAESIEIEVLRTHHGPIIASHESDGNFPEDKAVTARWAVLEVEVPARASYLLLKAGRVADVVGALEHWHAPGQNFVFADTSGNIGYWCSAAIPIRKKGNGLLPMPGWTPTSEWAGFIAFGDLPHIIDPPEGYIASANNPVAEEVYPHTIGTYWEPIDRISRIRDRINAKPKLSVDDMMSMQNDIFSPLAVELTAAILTVLKNKPKENDEIKMMEILKKWDFQMSAGSSAASIVETTYLKLLENIFQDELGEELYRRYIGLTIFAPRALRQILRAKHSGWLDNIQTPEKETLTDIIEKSINQAFKQLRKQFGPDIEKWTWGHMHTLTFHHILGERKPLNRIFELGPYPSAGSHLTVNKKQYDYTAPFAVKEGVSQRMIVDLSVPETAYHILPTGQSGLIGNSHYDDQVALYLEGRYRYSWLNRSDIIRHLESELVLAPR